MEPTPMENAVEKNRSLRIGWAQADITPDRPVLLAGQFHARVSEGVMDPISATVLAVESENDAGTSGRGIMVSCDLATISDELRDVVRERVSALGLGLDPRDVFLGATHTHAAPDVRLVPYGMLSGNAEPGAGSSLSSGADRRSMWQDLDLDVMYPAEYLPWVADQIAAAIRDAWEKRAPAGIAYGLGHAVVGRNRRLTYADGTSKMYGKPNVPEFRHVEGYEDHSVQALMTYDRDREITGMIVNVPCPSQVTENIYRISADYWHEVREELRKRFGKDLYVLGQCSAAGDQSPHVLIKKRAEERMWKLKGQDTNQNAPRAEIAQKIADAVSDIVTWAETEIDWNPVFAHTVADLELPRRLIDENDVAEALEEARPYREQYEKLMREIKDNPDIRKTPRWYHEVTRAYRRTERGARVKKRFEIQKTHPRMPIEVHALRLGDVAMATNPFELYVDYGIRIQELSPAIQTFLIQKAGCNGTYLPSERTVAHKGYGSVPASTDIGPEGGDLLVDWTVGALNGLFG